MDQKGGNREVKEGEMRRNEGRKGSQDMEWHDKHCIGRRTPGSISHG